MEAGRRTLPGVPKYLYGMSVPSRASAGRLPRASSAHRVVCPPPASCLWQTLSVGTAGGPRGWRWWLAAGVWGEVAWLGGPPRPFCPSVGAGRRYQARIAWSVGDGRALRAQKGCRQPSISSRCQRPTAPICCHLGWEGFVFFFPVCLCPFLLLSFPSSWESAGGFSLHLIFHQKCRLGLSPWDSTGDEGGMGRQPRLPQVPGLSRKRIPPS